MSDERTQLLRGLTLADATSLVIGSIIGAAGLFLFPRVAKNYRLEK